MNWQDVEGYAGLGCYFFFEKILKKFPQNKISVLEVGSYQGKSALMINHICNTLKKEVDIHCIDAWPDFIVRETEFEEAWPPFYQGGIEIKKNFLQNIKDFPNITYEKIPLQFPMSFDNHKFGPSYDLIYIDADHSEQSTYACIDAWLPYCKGYLIIDDYFSEAMDSVKRGTDRVVEERGLTLSMDVRRNNGAKVWIDCTT
jgi:hypothetical protein